MKRDRVSRGLLCPLLKYGQKWRSKMVSTGSKCLPCEAHLEQLGPVKRQAMDDPKTSQLIPTAK